MVSIDISRTETLTVVRRVPIAALGLCGHAVGAAEQVEIVDVGRADIDLQGGKYIGHRHAEELRLGAVDVEI